MTTFRFPLRRVLEWRHAQLELEEVKFRQQAAILAALDRQRAELEAEGIRAEVEVRDRRHVTGSDLSALGKYRLFIKDREAHLAQERAACSRLLEERQTAMLEARRRFCLLEKLKERRFAEWEKARDKELEEVASESFLARWSRSL